MPDKRIEQAAHIMVDEARRRKETSADLWSRYITNIEKIPEKQYKAAGDVIIRACEILEQKQS